MRHRKRADSGGRAPFRAPLPAAALKPFLFGVLLILTLGAHRASAQQAITSATLNGHVEDATGAPLPGATVTTTAVDTDRQQTAVSDGEGRYRFPYMSVGTYLLRAEKAGFASLNVRLTVTVGQALDLPLRLSPSGINESVVVTATEAPAFETARTQVAETIVTGEIGSLPLNGRNYLDLAALVPGVSRTNPVSNQRFPETSAVPGTGLSITGQRFINNGFIVDGLSSNDDAADLAGSFYSQEVIREFEVVTSGGVAEFGRASGGFVNIITRSGTNDFSGRALRLPAQPAARRAQPPLADQRPADAGAIRRFLRRAPPARPHLLLQQLRADAAEQRRRRHHHAGERGGRQRPPRRRRLPGAAYFKRPRSRRASTRPTFSSRLDHQVGQASQLAARYNLYDIKSLNARNVGGLNTMSRGTALSNRDQTVAASLVTTLGSRALNEARFQFTRSRLGAPVNDETGPAVNISGVANFGTATFSPTRRDLDLSSWWIM